MRKTISLPLAGERAVKFRYARENVSPETYYDHMHDHPFFEICIPISGSMVHIAGGRTHSLSYGDVYFCRPGELHYALAAEVSVYERYAFWIPADAYSWTGSEAGDPLALFSDPRLDGANVVRIDSSRMWEFAQLLDAVRGEMRSQSPGAPLAIFCRFTELMLFICDAAVLNAGDSDGINGREHSPAIIHNVIRYVRDNYRTVTGIDEVADHFYLNKDYLTRVFKKFTGFTVHDYIRSVRISKSRMMLDGGAGVTEVAFACGFNSTSYFIRVFTRAVGVSPGEYRRTGKNGTINE